jgi:hypothetical protein
MLLTPFISGALNVCAVLTRGRWVYDLCRNIVCTHEDQAHHRSLHLHMHLNWWCWGPSGVLALTMWQLLLLLHKQQLQECMILQPAIIHPNIQATASPPFHKTTLPTSTTTGGLKISRRCKSLTVHNHSKQSLSLKPHHR